MGFLCPRLVLLTVCPTSWRGGTLVRVNISSPNSDLCPIALSDEAYLFISAVHAAKHASTIASQRGCASRNSVLYFAHSICCRA